MYRSILLSVIILVSTVIGGCQETNSPEAYFSAIIVKDMDQSLAWYQKVLNLELVNKIDLEERGIKQANLISSSTWIELIQLKGAIDQNTVLKSAGPKSKLTGIFKIGFQINDFDQFLAFIKTENIDTIGGVVSDSESGKRMIILKDPDGNRVQFFEK